MSAKKEIDTEVSAKKVTAKKAAAKKAAAEKAAAEKAAAEKAAAEKAAAEKAAAEEAAAEKAAAEKAAAEKTAASDSKVRPIPYFHRIRVTELASQMVSAQIVAHATHQAAIDVVTAQREMVVACLDALAGIACLPHGEAARSHAATVADTIKHHVRVLQSQIVTPETPEPLGLRKFDSLFASARQRVHEMLTPPARDHRPVWAEQLFEPEEVMPESKIGERFNSYGWRRMLSRASVRELMTKVDGWFSKHYADLADEFGQVIEHPRLSPDSDETRTLERARSYSLQRAQVPFDADQSNYREIADAISRLLSPSPGVDMWGPVVDAEYKREVARGLIREFYNGKVPTPRHKPESVESGKVKTGKKRPKAPDSEYRPWAVFRYLRCFAGGPGDEIGDSIKSGIQTRVSALTPQMGFKIWALLPSDSQFGPIMPTACGLLPLTHEETDGTADELAEEMGWK